MIKINNSLLHCFVQKLDRSNSSHAVCCFFFFFFAFFFFCFFHVFVASCLSSKVIPFFFQKIFNEHFQSVKRLGSRSGLSIRRSCVCKGNHQTTKFDASKESGRAIQ